VVEPSGGFVAWTYVWVFVAWGSAFAKEEEASWLQEMGELSLAMVGGSKSMVGGGNMLMHGLAQQSKVKFQMMTISFQMMFQVFLSRFWPLFPPSGLGLDFGIRSFEFLPFGPSSFTTIHAHPFRYLTRGVACFFSFLLIV
jgi:hypothetical protein